MRVLSLFAGIGGLDLGLEAHGCRTVAYSEIDPYAATVMAQRFPGAVNLGDVTTIDWSSVDEQHGPFDIICGGFPCQDISLAGKGAGLDGERSGLWRHYADAVRVLRPGGVLVENVAALLARGIDRVLGDLAACGFDAEWDCVPAAAVGAPHLRDRVFIVAYGTDAGPPGRRRGAMADAGSEGRRQVAGGASGDEGADGRGAQANHLARGAEPTAADTAGRRQSGPRQPVEPLNPTTSSNRQAVDALDGRGWPQPRGSEWWRVEPDVGRVADGVPARMDRLRCLGNAVVPAVAEHVAGILLDRMGAAHGC